jgi:hypothetical protein
MKHTAVTYTYKFTHYTHSRAFEAHTKTTKFALTLIVIVWIISIIRSSTKCQICADVHKALAAKYRQIFAGNSHGGDVIQVTRGEHLACKHVRLDLVVEFCVENRDLRKDIIFDGVGNDFFFVENCMLR